MLNQEQLAAIAAAMSILQQQQQQQQALINQYQVELQQIQDQRLDQPTNRLNGHGGDSYATKLRSKPPPPPALSPPQQNPPTANFIPQMQLPNLHQQRQQSLLSQYQAELQQIQNRNSNQPTSQLNNHDGDSFAAKLRSEPPLSALTPPQQHTPTATIVPHMQLAQLNHHHQQQRQEQQQSHTNQLQQQLLLQPQQHGRATNLLGFMGLYVGNLSPDLTKEQLERIFSKYGEPVKAHRLIRSPVAFIKYENTESPRAAIDDLYGVLLPELTLNPDQPLKLHFDRNDAQLKANYRPTELPKDDNGECYGWRTTVCRRGKNCPKKHIPINRGIDFQMWMIKSTPTSSSANNSSTFVSTK